MSDPRPFDERRRKLVHVAMLGFALLLRPLSWWQALLLAAAALLYNAFAFRRLHGDAVLKEGERGERFARGLVYYPLSVFLLVLIYRGELIVAGAGWAILALGDGAATLVGRAVGGPALPWNRAKTFSGSLGFVLAAAAGAFGFGCYLAERTASGEPASVARIAVAAIVAALVAALVESIELGIDDNLTAPNAGAAVFWLCLHADVAVLASAALARSLAIGFGVSLATGLLALLARAVDVRGLVVGTLIGTAVWSGGGAGGYAALFAFFVLATLATKIGYRQKAARGLAEARGGRRSIGSVIAKGLVGAACSIAAALVPELRGAFLIGLVAAFATAAADTVSSEIGKAFGRTAVLATNFRRVAPGTEGAISLEGTTAGWLAGLLVAAVGGALGVVGGPAVAAIALAAALANHLESVAGHLFGAEGELQNEVLNFLVTLAGAVLAVAIAARV